MLLPTPLPMSELEFHEQTREEQTQDPSPGIKILEAIDRLVPKLTPSALTVLSVCVVEDLHLEFPDVKINLGRAIMATKSTNQEVLVPQINGLTIFNAPGIVQIGKQKYSKIQDALISNDKLFENQRAAKWYIELMEEFFDALSDYMLSMPLTVSHVEGLTYCTNFAFVIQPGDKRKINTNFRWPKYFNMPMTLTLQSDDFNIKKKTISALFEAQVDSNLNLKKVGALFPKPAVTSVQGNTVKMDNSKIVAWVANHLSVDLIDQCYDGIFAPIDVEARIQFTILNETNNQIEVEPGTKLAELKMKFF